MASYLAYLLAAATCAATMAASFSASHHPDLEAAQNNSFALFNSIHSAMRQFGSSVHHNGMSFYLAQAPEGSVFYHGNYRTDKPPAFDWLAFEVEHGYSFGRSFEKPPFTPPPPHNQFDSMGDLLSHQIARRISQTAVSSTHLAIEPSAQRPLFATSDEEGQFPGFNRSGRGYFHTYIANRPLNLLYIDGQAAAKCGMGPLDTQDLVLLDWVYDGDDGRYPPLGEVQRATDLCALAKAWRFDAGGKIDGFVRMEAGFEIVYCDFFDGLDLLSVQATPFQNETDREVQGTKLTASGKKYGWRINDLQISSFEWLRAAATRYHGQPAGRLDVDWSSMVSAYAYSVNVSNPNADRQDLPRLLNATRPERQNIRARLHDVLRERGGRANAAKGVVNWQSVVDRIVTRFSKRLWWLGYTSLERLDLIPGIATLVDPFVSYLDNSPDVEERAVERCAQHYFDARLLRPASWTPEDRVIAAAVQAVSRSICSSLFAARAVLRADASDADPGTEAEKAQKIIQTLISELRWSTWRECEGCGVDEICVIPMFPMGSEEDYFHPKCKNMTGTLASKGYWGPFGLV